MLSFLEKGAIVESDVLTNLKSGGYCGQAEGPLLIYHEITMFPSAPVLAVLPVDVANALTEFIPEPPAPCVPPAPS